MNNMELYTDYIKTAKAGTVSMTTIVAMAVVFTHCFVVRGGEYGSR